jgi:AraC family transcriptional regulator
VEVNFIERNEFMIVGIETYTKNDFETINSCWSTLYLRMNEINNKLDTNITYGYQDYSKDFDIVNLAFYYTAAIEVSSLDNIPKGMVGKTIPPSKYAVFTHEGSKEDISKTIRNIYSMWFYEFEYELNDNVCGDFEYYPKGYKNTEDNGKIDIYIPIK